MHGPADYGYSPFAANAASFKSNSTSNHTSSAFSASAKPGEDWTKISDLAERRRIQNRIAQRNYRKKLKKRMEEPKGRAGPTSPSSEGRYEDRAEVEFGSSAQSSIREMQLRSLEMGQIRDYRALDILPPQHVLQSDNLGMSSPPPFSYDSLSMADSPNYPTGAQSASYGMPDSRRAYPQSLPPLQQNYQSFVPSITTLPVEPEYSCSMSYATIAGVDMSTAYF